MKNLLGASVMGIFYIALLLVGFLQIGAGIAALTYLGLPKVVAIAMALLWGWIPVIGSGVAMYGAIHAWHWSVSDSFFIFFGPIVVFALFVPFSALFDSTRRK